MNRRVQQLSGQTFGRLTVIDFAHSDKRGDAWWNCLCACGTAKPIRAFQLRNGDAKSCGCASRIRKPRTHGLTNSSEYKVWLGMKHRCKNPTATGYAYYGARGIRVCERWLRFENFLADMGTRPSPNHSIDRVNGNGNYEPGNCRWATHSEQMLNRREWQPKKPSRK